MVLKPRGDISNPLRANIEIRWMKLNGFWQRMASAGERPGNLKRFGADGYPSKLAESIPSSSGTVTKGNSF
jgi:hypothetical protein